MFHLDFAYIYIITQLDIIMQTTTRPTLITCAICKNSLNIVNRSGIKYYQCCGCDMNIICPIDTKRH